MKRYMTGRLCPFFCAAILATVLFGCTPEAAPVPADDVISIADDAGQDTPSEKDSTDLLLPGLETPRDPFVVLPPNEEAMVVITENLDLDVADEQILFIKDSTDLSAPTRIAIVDQDSLTGEYRISWSATSLVDNTRNLDFKNIDVIGDQIGELVVRGTTRDGLQVMEIYRQQGTGFALGYQVIFQEAVEGTLELQVFERPESYQFRLGDPFPVLATVRDPDSDNISDLLEITYTWSPQSGRYLRSEERKIPGEVIEDQTVRKLITSGNRDEYLKFLAGPWFKTEGGKPQVFLDIDLRTTMFSIFDGDMEEIFRWDPSTRNFLTIWNGRPTLYGNNTQVQHLIKKLEFEIKGVNRVEITVSNYNRIDWQTQPVPEWTGEYQRLTPDLQDAMIQQINGPSLPSGTLPSLSGYYTNNRGDELIFTSPTFILREGDTESSGGYATYYLDQPLLGMKFLNPDGTVAETRTYRMEYGETVRETDIIRLLTLTPGHVGVFGFEAYDEQPLKFEQIEEIQPDSGS